MKTHATLNRWQYALKTLRVRVCLSGALLIGWGNTILGENRVDITIVTGIGRIGIISASTKTLTHGRDE